MAIDSNMYWQYADRMPTQKYTNALNSFQNNYNTSKRRMLADEEMQMRQAQEKRQQELYELKLRQYEEEKRQKEAQQAWLQNALSPQQPFSAQGPYSGGLNRPNALTKQPVGREDLVKGMLQRGMIDGGDYLSATKPKEPPAKNPTDLGEFVDNFTKAWELENGVPAPARIKAQAFLIGRRAQEEEASSVETARLLAQLNIRPDIAREIAEAEAGVKIGTAGDVAAAGEAGKFGAVNAGELYTKAQAARGDIAKINELITHLETSDAITGAGAELFKGLERVKALVGNEKAAGKVIDTEYLDALMGSEVFPLIKQLGIGARGMDTPAERKFLRQVMTGEITLNKGTLIRMAKIRRKAAARNVNEYNERVKSGSLNKWSSDSGVPVSVIDLTSTGKPKTAEEYLQSLGDD